MDDEELKDNIEDHGENENKETNEPYQVKRPPNLVYTIDSLPYRQTSIGVYAVISCISFIF